jgi:hypothetical protein
MNEAKTEAKPETADELEVLAPDRTLDINGETITVREFRFLEGLRAATHARPILKDMTEIFAQGEGQEPALEELEDIFSRHADAFLALMSLSIGKPVEWFAGLSDMEGRLLLLAFWEVNSRFFMSRLVLGAITRLATQKPQAAPAPGAK